MPQFSGNNFSQALLNTLSVRMSSWTLTIGFHEEDSSQHDDESSLQQLAELREYGGWLRSPNANLSKTNNVRPNSYISAQFRTLNAVGHATLSAHSSTFIPAKTFFRTAISVYTPKWKQNFVHNLKQVRFNVNNALAQLGKQVVNDIRTELMKQLASEDPDLVALDKRLSQSLTWQVHTCR